MGAEVAAPPLTKARARELTDLVKTDLLSLRIHIAELYLGNADRVLGYESWDEYRAAEFKGLGLALPTEERRAEVQSLAELGYPTRAIAAAVGVSQPSVINDLRRSALIDEDREDEVIDAELVDEEPEPASSATGGDRRAAFPDSGPLTGDALMTPINLALKIIEGQLKYLSTIDPEVLAATTPARKGKWWARVNKYCAELDELRNHLGKSYLE